MMKNRVLFMIFFVVILGSCCHRNREETTLSILSIDSTYYAEGFSIKRFKDYICVDVCDPWNRDTAKLLQRYILVEKGRPLPKSLPKGTLVRTPLDNIIVYTSVHCSIIEQLGEIDKIVGVCEPQYIDSKKVLQMVEQGKIVDLGEAASPNIEKIIEAKGEVIMASPFENCGYGAAEKIGVPIIEGADYMEKKPLGRAEWIRFYGLLLGQSERADSIFEVTMRHYNDLKELAASANMRPTLFVERKYGSSWSLPGGESYMSQLYEDAGADYLFSSLHGAGSVPLSFESVLDKAIHADYWLLKYYQQDASMTYNDLKNEYNPYQQFDAFKNRKIFACNTATTSYYDIITLHPDCLLEDLIYIFHPELLPDYKSRYFFPLGE